MTPLKRAIDIACSAVVILAMGWWTGYLVQTCRATKACERAGNVEAADCEQSLDHSRLICEWRCVAPGSKP